MKRSRVKSFFAFLIASLLAFNAVIFDSVYYAMPKINSSQAVNSAPKPIGAKAVVQRAGNLAGSAVKKTVSATGHVVKAAATTTVSAGTGAAVGAFFGGPVGALVGAATGAAVVAIPGALRKAKETK